MSNQIQGGFNLKEQLNGDYWDKIDALAIIGWRFSIVFYLIVFVVMVIIVILTIAIHDALRPKYSQETKNKVL